MDANPVKLPPNFDVRSPSAADEWGFWKCLFQDYLMAIGQEEAADKIKISLLRNMMGPESTKVILSLKPKKESYESLIDTIDKYVSPRRNEVFERFKFNSRSQEPGESFDNFFTSLRQLIGSCNFGSGSEPLEDQLLRDRIVQGVVDKGLQESLLRVDGLTLEKAANLCRTCEISKIQMKAMNPIIEIDAISRDDRNISRNRPQPNKKGDQKESKFYCRRCQQKHGPRQCPAFGKKCSKCGIENHFAVSCRVRKVQEVHYEDESDESVYCGAVNEVTNVDRSDWFENIVIEGKNVKCKLDTGADVSIMPKSIFDVINSNLNFKLYETTLKVESFVGERVTPLGIVNLKCTYKQNECYENFIIVNIDINKEQFIKQNIRVFEGIGRLPGKVDIPTRVVQDQICHSSPRLPSCLHQPLKDELARLEERKAIDKVVSINEKAFVNRIVIVEKPNGKVRLCLDPMDLNKIIVKKPKVLPTLDDLSLRLYGKKFFSVLDLSEGFHHLLLTEESSWKCCFATPFGVYRYLVLPYGLMNAPELFQDVLENHFSKIENVIVWADDILVMGSTAEEHDVALLAVMEKAKELGIVFNKNKFQYKQTEVKYVGQIFNEHGMSIDKDRVQSLISLKEPTDRDNLRQILGSFNYVRRYVPDMANLMAPLCKLLKKNMEFIWLPAHRLAFAELKRKVCSTTALSPFDTKKKIILQCDASKSGLGCCLFQKDESNILKLVACASRTMNDTELNYSQTEKEFLSICYAVKKFHRYIYGANVEVQTDHKPIVSIMLKPICKIGSPRLKRLRLKLLMYNLNVYYVPGKLLHFADMLSRHSLKFTEEDKEMLQMVHSVTVHLPMSKERKLIFQKETKSDPILSVLYKYYMEGWPEQNKVAKELKRYYKLKEDIYFECGLAFYQNKLIVPISLRLYVLKLVHEGHPGIVKSLTKARQLFYWPGLSKDICELIKRCRTCEKFQPANTFDKLLPHKIPKQRYAKVGTDILDFAGRSYLVIIDYFSHWLEILPLNNKSSDCVINAFQEVFTRLGYPQEIIADNNPFSSFECQKYYKSKDMVLTTSSPHYPKSNGMAEKAVHISKMILKKAHEDRVDYRNYILSYNNTPLIGLNVSPSQILNSRRLRNLIPTNAKLLEPKIEHGVYKLLLLRQSFKQNSKFVRKKEVEYNVGDNIVHKTDREKTWEKGKIIGKCPEPRSYLIEGRKMTVRRNSKHLRKSFTDNCMRGNTFNNVEEFCNNFNVNNKETNPPLNQEAYDEVSSISNNSPTDIHRGVSSNVKTTRSGRIIRPPVKLDL